MHRARAVNPTRRVVVAFVPKERLAGRVIESASIRASVGLQLMKRRFFVDSAAESQATVDVMDRLRVRADSVETPLKSLSGGPAKVALGKWLSTSHVLDIGTLRRAGRRRARTEIYLNPGGPRPPARSAAGKRRAQ